MLESLISRYGYLAILVGTFLEGETILVLGGFAAHRHLLSLPGVMLAAFIGSLASDQLFFCIGRRCGPAFVAKRPRLAAGVERVRGLARRYDALLILSFRFLYGLRNVTPLALGMSDVPVAKFAVLNAIAAAVWAIAVAGLGWYVGGAAKELLGHIERYEIRVAAGIAAVGALFWLRRLCVLRRRNTVAAARQRA
ncbi:MAG: DedA family protein [Candidatus Binatia bacterium]